MAYIFDPKNELSQEADRRFKEKAFQISPRFPSAADQREKLLCKREQRAANLCLIAMVASGVVWYEQDFWHGLIVFAVGFVGFVSLCFYAGNRQTLRNNIAQSERRGQRPF